MCQADSSTRRFPFRIVTRPAQKIEFGTPGNELRPDEIASVEIPEAWRKVIEHNSCLNWAGIFLALAGLAPRDEEFDLWVRPLLEADTSSPAHVIYGAFRRAAEEYRSSRFIAPVILPVQEQLPNAAAFATGAIDGNPPA